MRTSSKPKPIMRRPPKSIHQTTQPISGSSSNSPKIGGSEAAFIVLVIILVVIVIFASIGIYYLLRDGEPSDADRAARRKYSIRGSGARKHSLPIGLPGSISGKISSLFKGRRTGAGWVPANDANDEADEWDSKDEPLPAYHHPDLPYDAPPKQQYPRVGSAPSSHRTTLTEASESLHKSHMASQVDDPSEEEDFNRVRFPIVHVQAPSGPDGVWLNAHDGRRGGLGGVDTDTDTRHMGYYAPQPRRADSGPEIPLFAGSTPFRQDI